MPPRLKKLYDFLYAFEECYVFEQEKRPKGGRRRTYSHTGFILFFISMFLRRTFAYKTMARLAKSDFAKYGFPSPPSRRTIRERFKQMPPVIVHMMPRIAKHCFKDTCRRTFNIKWLFSDKSIFRANGGLWHKKHMENGEVPHPSIDTEATWAYSPYHKWRFGHALLIMVNERRFPVAAVAGTANLDEPGSLPEMVRPVRKQVGIIVGDAAYKVYRVIRELYNDHDILLQVRDRIKDKAMGWYRDLVHTPQALWLYLKRKPSVEPAFALIKELFDLEGEKQLPYKGEKYVVPFLLTTAITVQIMAVFNFFHNNKLGHTYEFCELF